MATVVPVCAGPADQWALAPASAISTSLTIRTAQLKKIADARRSDFEAAGQKVRAAREGMRALVEADSINESAIRAKSAEIAAAEADVMILNAKVRQESLQVLTSEQQAKLKEQRTAREGQSRQRKPRGQ